MKKQYVLIFIFILFGVSVLGQKKYNIQVSKPNSDNKANYIDSKVKTQFYCLNATPDSLYLNNDSLIFSKNVVNYNYPKLILYENSKFRFTYKIHFDTIKLVDPKNNAIETKVIMTAKDLQGDWNTIDLHKKISLIFKNSLSNFKVTETDKWIYFIKDKK